MRIPRQKAVGAAIGAEGESVEEAWREDAF
jgi:hypothetical protein